MKAPFPWFGGKRRVADIVWERFGDVPNYVEPFAGSLAVLLARPHDPRAETVNDLDCYLANFWRALKHVPDQVVANADAPVNEADLHARHLWLVKQEEFREHMKTDPDHYDAKIAGWWVWGISQWIGSGWCSKPEWRGRVAVGKQRGIHSQRVDQKRPNLKRGGVGVHRTRPDVSDANGRGVIAYATDEERERERERERESSPEITVNRARGRARRPSRQLPDINARKGIHKYPPPAIRVPQQVPCLSSTGQGINGHRGGFDEEVPMTLLDYFHALASRLRRVRVCCGDWQRIVGPSPTVHLGTTAVFLDPPYADAAGRSADIYSEDSLTVAHEVRAWAIENGEHPELRIALCGYDGEHAMPASWECVAWKSAGGYGSQSDGAGRVNSERERIWFSPHCLKKAADAGRQEVLFE